jgi:hypothetical protein
LGWTMVEFVRDVVIVVAILVTLVAVALNPRAEADATRKVDQLSTRTISTPGSTPSPAVSIVTPPPAPQTNAR